jgi:predicted RNA-binding Zn ribbon-like protein
MTQPSRGAARDLVPGFPDDLCLGFANTRYYRGSDAPTETLTDLDALFGWCRSATLLSAGGERMLRRAWAEEIAGSLAFRDAVALREMIYRVFFCVAEAKAPAGADLDALNRALRTAPERIGIARSGPGFAWRVTPIEQPSVAALLAPVAWSAANLLTGPRLPRVRHCANQRCLWMFLDDSKSGTRRWCSMSACGNRAKVHRHYVRQKEGRAPLGRVAG